MSLEIRVGGVPVERQKGSVRIRRAVEARGTASVTVVDRFGTASYSRGQSVEIIRLVPGGVDVTLFSGVIAMPEYRVQYGQGVVHHHLVCTDWTYLADKRLAAESYLAQTAKFIVEDLHTKYLAAEGVTLGTIETGATIAEMIVNYRRISDAYDALAQASDYIWYIDDQKRLFFTARSTTPAPFLLTPRDIRRHSAKRRVDALQYRNRQYLQAGRATTALQTENRTGDGETVAFAMGYPLVSVPTITVGGAAQTIGIKGIDTAKDWYWNKGDAIVTAAVAPAIAAAIVVAYYGEYDILVMAEDVAEQTARAAVEGNTGIVESITESPDLDTLAGAMEKASATLDTYKVPADVFPFETLRHGLLPGQLLTINYPEYGYNNSALLIESVDIAEFSPEVLLYSVRAVEGPILGDWTKLFRPLAEQRVIQLGPDRLLIILSKYTGLWDWSDAVTETAFACPICGPLTICGPTTIVC